MRTFARGVIFFSAASQNCDVWRQEIGQTLRSLTRRFAPASPGWERPVVSVAHDRFISQLSKSAARLRRTARSSTRSPPTGVLRITNPGWLSVTRPITRGVASQRMAAQGFEHPRRYAPAARKRPACLRWRPAAGRGPGFRMRRARCHAPGSRSRPPRSRVPARGDLDQRRRQPAARRVAHRMNPRDTRPAPPPQFRAAAPCRLATRLRTPDPRAATGSRCHDRRSCRRAGSRRRADPR